MLSQPLLTESSEGCSTCPSGQLHFRVTGCGKFPLPCFLCNQSLDQEQGCEGRNMGRVDNSISTPCMNFMDEKLLYNQPVTRQLTCFSRERFHTEAAKLVPKGRLEYSGNSQLGSGGGEPACVTQFLSSQMRQLCTQVREQTLDWHLGLLRHHEFLWVWQAHPCHFGPTGFIWNLCSLGLQHSCLLHAWKSSSIQVTPISHYLDEESGCLDPWLQWSLWSS